MLELALNMGLLTILGTAAYLTAVMVYTAVEYFAPKWLEENNPFSPPKLEE